MHGSSSLEQIRCEIERRTPGNPATHGWSSYSQCDEDGIIRECLRRIASKNDLDGTCLEVGCGDGLENNTSQLIIDGYKAVWIDSDELNIDKIRCGLGATLFPSLFVLQESVSLQNADKLAITASCFLNSRSIDLLSIDIDGVDFYIASSFMSALKPKLICVEYNAAFPPPTKIAIKYDENHGWAGDNYFGATLSAWVQMMSRQGYSLVSCNASGVNAFFVKNDLCQGFETYSIESLYMPPRYNLVGSGSCHPKSYRWIQLALEREFVDADLGRCEVGLLNEVYSLASKPKVAIADTHYGKMAVDLQDCVIGTSLLQNGRFQEEKVSEVVDFLSQKFNFTPELFFDIGANIGTHTIYALENNIFDRAICIEPEHGNCSLLKVNIAIHDLVGRCKIYSAALTDFEGTVEMLLSGVNYGDHRIRPKCSNFLFNEDNERSVSRVECVTLDSSFSEILNDCEGCLMWVDTQGHEGHIFGGGSNFFKNRQAPLFILTEFWPYGLECSGGKEAYFNFLENCSAVYDINEVNWQKKPGICLNNLQQVYSDMLLKTEKEYHPHSDLLLVMSPGG